MSKNTGHSNVAVLRSARKPWYDITALTAGDQVLSSSSAGKGLLISFIGSYVSDSVV